MVCFRRWRPRVGEPPRVARTSVRAPFPPPGARTEVRATRGGTWRPDAAATRAALEELQELERRVAASRASLEKTVEQRDRDRRTLDVIREVARDGSRRKR